MRWSSVPRFLFWLLRRLVCWDRSMDSCKEPGLLAQWRRSGPELPCIGGEKLKASSKTLYDDPSLHIITMAGLSGCGLSGLCHRTGRRYADRTCAHVVVWGEYPLRDGSIPGLRDRYLF